MDKKQFSELSPVELVARVMRAEARNQGNEGMLMVGTVIRNRLKDGRFGKGWHGVCLKQKAFSCFSDKPWNAENRPILDEPATYLQTELATTAMYGIPHDDRGGATHYCNPGGMTKKMLRVWLTWKVEGKMVGCGVVGDHILFREVR